MSIINKEKILEKLDALDIQLDRLIKSSELLPEPEDAEDIKKIIEEIVKITGELKKL